jgi:hypothetical protein
MGDVTIRIHLLTEIGTIEDTQNDYDLSSFGGFLPSVGDVVLDPGVLMNLDRREPMNRRMWTVVKRVFNPRDLENYVALVVEESTPTKNDYPLLPGD